MEDKVSALLMSQPFQAKNPFDRSRVRRLDEDLAQYFETLDGTAHPPFAQPNSSNTLDQLRREQSFVESYNDRLFQTYRDLSKLSGGSLSDDISKAMRMLKTRPTTKLAVPASTLDPLLMAYEQKIDILESQVL
jgi:hypothetical protein